MINKSVIALCLCGVTWAGTCQAGFFGNDRDLQFLHDINNAGDTVAGAKGSDNGTLGSGQHTAQIMPKPDNSEYRPGNLRLIAATQQMDVGVTPAASVPEPGTFYLVALGGLVIIGMTAHGRHRARAEAPLGDDHQPLVTG